MLASPPPFTDYRHLLSAEEHETLFFAFTAADGQTFGLLRLMFGGGEVA